MEHGSSFARSFVELNGMVACDGMIRFIAGKMLAANQIEFGSLVVDRVVTHGAVDSRLLTVSLGV
jgi:hypothetical protein